MTRTTLAFLILLLAGLLLPAGSALADLTITPTRVVFLARDRSATVTLLNVTDHTNTYRMGWLIMKADANGKYKLLPATDENDPHSVAKMVVFSPRQVTIGPHAHQSIRLSLRRPSDLPPGEYRAHLAMTRLANDAPPPKDNPDKKGRTVALNVNLGFSIPVIVRGGEDRELKISLSAPELTMGGKNKSSPVLNLDINRDAGKFSSYGLIRVFWQPPKGEEQEIGILNNVALYPEVQSRHISIALQKNPTEGNLHIVYLGKYESEGTIWAEKSFAITR